MAHKAELEIIKQLFDNLDENDKKSFLKSIKSKSSTAETLNLTIKPKNCPHCHSTLLRKMARLMANNAIFALLVIKHSLIQTTRFFMVLKKICLFGKNTFIA